MPEGMEQEVVVNQTKVSCTSVADTPFKHSASIKELHPVTAVVKAKALELIPEVMHPEEILTDESGNEEKEIVFDVKEENDFDSLEEREDEVSNEDRM